MIKITNFFKKKVKQNFIVRFFGLPLSTQIMFSILFGTVFGLLLRFFPQYFLNFGLTSSSFQNLGNLFINLIKMISAPMIFACIMSSVVSLGGSSKIGKITTYSMLVFISLTIICISSGMIGMLVFHPGSNSSFNADFLLNEYNDGSKNAMIENLQRRDNNLFSFLFNLVPSNIFVAFVHANMLQIIFFAIIIAMAVSRVDEKRGTKISKGIKLFADVLLEGVSIVMKFAPFGTFGMITWLIATQKIELLASLGKFIVVAFFISAFLVYVIYSAILVPMGLNPLRMWKKLWPAQIIALLTTSTTAALPSAMNIANKKLGVSEENTNFVIPLCSIVNTSGSAMYFTVMALFISQLFNIQLDQQQYLTIFTMSIFCSLGTAPIPGGALLVLGNIFLTVGIPIEALSIAFAIDRILDMARTFVNVTGDTFSAVIVDNLNGTLNKKVFNSKRHLLFGKI